MEAWKIWRMICGWLWMCVDSGWLWIDLPTGHPHIWGSSGGIHQRVVHRAGKLSTLCIAPVSREFIGAGGTMDYVG